MPGFDSHAHLHFNHFIEDLDKVAQRAAAAGISDVMIPSVDLPTSLRSVQIASEYGYRAAVAFHPEHLPEHDADIQWRGIRKLLIEPEAIAIGETGLDFYHETFTPDFQIMWFHRHIDLARDIGFPLIVHSRDAEEEVLSQLPSSMAVPVILHCWNGNSQLTAEAVSRGFYIGAGGPLTYKKNHYLRQVIQNVPHELLLSETDSPFLPPEPCRGRRNEPAYTRKVIEKIRELKGENRSIEDISHMLWENAMRAFLIHPENRRADIVYSYGDSLYINLTSRCQNSCRFCIRSYSDTLNGHFLRHREDPPEATVLSTLEALPVEEYPEMVFCGFGEPTLRHDLLAKCAGIARRKGMRTRLNTNGLCTSFMSDDDVAKLLRAVDSVSVSLNASGEREYNRICPSQVSDSWNHLLKFVKMAAATDIEVVVTAVKGSGADIHRTETLANRLGVPLRVRGS